jgi:hypothetical protein
MSNLVYIHIGKPIPDYLYDNLYQTILLHEYKIKIYIILDDSEIPTFHEEVSKFNYNLYCKNEFYYKTCIEVIPLSILDIALSQNLNFDEYKKTISDRFSSLGQFRDGFWISTTARFYYIGILMKLFSLKDVFHIENDVMLYETIDNLYNYILDKQIDKDKQKQVIDKICMVEDSKDRVIPSILFFPNTNSIDELTQYITTTIKSSPTFINDMNILGSFENKYCLPIFPDFDNPIVFDGAAIGQYLGGVDYKNLPNGNTDIVKYNNPSKGFINETAEINCRDYTFLKTRILLDFLNISIKVNRIQDTSLHQIANLHIHSKQLYQFSSIFDINYNDIITGDRITSLCDFVLTTPEIYNFHKNLDKFSKEIIIIKDFKNIKINLLNIYFSDHCKKNKTNVVKIFLYTHIVQQFIHFILPFLNNQFKYVLYIHNSDHSFTVDYKKLVDSNIIEKIYTQNVDINTNMDIDNKITLLPIGIANSMWKHGNVLELYSIMSYCYKINKTDSIYVNINPNTYSYRKNILDKIVEKNSFTLHCSSKPYKEYLMELSKYRFCLCIRGNGIDTHRFWESLYLGVIPVIINNKTTQCTNFINYLNKLNIPFYEIKSDNLDVIFTKFTSEYFNESLYKNIIKKTGESIFNIDSLKLQYYEYKKDTI